MTSVLLQVKDLPENHCEVDCWISSSGNVPLYLMGDSTKLVKFPTIEEAQAYIFGVSALVELLNADNDDYQIIKKKEVF